MMIINALGAPFGVTAAEETINPLLPHIPDLLWGSIAFVLVFGFFYWKFMPSLTAMLDARKDAIEGGIKRAEIAQAEAEVRKGEYEEALHEARAEAAKIREQARADGMVILAELKEQSQVEANRIIASARATIEVERQNTLAALRSEVGSLALTLASGVIGESLSDDKKASGIVDRFLADLESSDKAGSTTKAKAGK